MTDGQRLQMAKALLAQELPVGLVAQQVGLSSARVRKAATEGGWLRRSRRDAYSAQIRVEALSMFEATGSRTATARCFGLARRTLRRWIEQASPRKKIAPIVWRCYTCSEFGAKVEGNACPGCGTLRAFE